MEYTQQNTRLPKNPEEKEDWDRLVVVLEMCPLKSIRNKDNMYELVTEKHRNYHAKYDNDPAEFRPDVVHQCLLHLLDSPLNRAAKLEVYLRTRHGVLIYVDPRMRVPRHYRLFEVMMVQLLHKLKIRATNQYLSLMRIVKNPVTDHLPPNADIFRVEKGAADLVNPLEFAASRMATEEAKAKVGKKRSGAVVRSNEGTNGLTLRAPTVLVIGGISRGDVKAEYATHEITISEKPLSAAACISRLVMGFEAAWGL